MPDMAGIAPIRSVVIDDNAILLKVWQRVLNDDGHRAFVTSDPDEALEKIDEASVDVVICDIVMPKMDGLEFARQVRALHPQVVIVLTTAYPCKFEDMNLGLGRRDVFFLSKPYMDVERVREFIDALINGGATQAVNENTEDRLAQEGLIHRFEYTFELAWKCLQDLLQERGLVDIRGPRPVLEQAFQDGLIADGVLWMEMLRARNESSHLYDEKVFLKIYHQAKDEFPKPLRALQGKLEAL